MSLELLLRCQRLGIRKDKDFKENKVVESELLLVINVLLHKEIRTLRRIRSFIVL